LKVPRFGIVVTPIGLFWAKSPYGYLHLPKGEYYVADETKIKTANELNKIMEIKD